MTDYETWRSKTVPCETVMARLSPGMGIFLGTGVAEPRKLVRHLMASSAGNLQDLELVQLVSLGDAVPAEGVSGLKYRLKTFFSGWVASDAITTGRIDLVPSRFSRIPGLIKSGRVKLDAAFVQVTPPDAAGYCSLGAAVDVARLAMERADFTVAEINPGVPRTFGDTFVSLDDFDMAVASDIPLFTFDRWPVDAVFDQVGANIASVIEDGSCIGFSIGPLFEAVARHLVHKRHLGIHSPFFTDALMDLVNSGAVTNRRKEIYRGKSLASYAFGTPALMQWLDGNPLVEFQAIDMVFSPLQIGRNPGVVTVMPARKVDLSGRLALHVGKGNVAAGPGEAVDFVNGAEMSRGGMTIFGLPSRNRGGAPNVRCSVEEMPNLFNLRESVDMVVTEYGVANLTGRTARERAQALIDIAHPGDRLALLEQAKAERILYADQMFVSGAAHLYPAEIATRQSFKNDVTIRFRAIRPSDEEDMRRLFYRFSNEAVYYRYFSSIKAMPHAKMQAYVNVDYAKVMSVVGVAGEGGGERIVAEARYVMHKDRAYADVAFVVDGAYEGMGIATYLYRMLIRLARERGVQGFTADVLASNKAMMRVFEKGDLPVRARLDAGVYELTIAFDA